MDNFDLMKARKNLVAIASDLIQKSRHSLSLVESKAILYLISKIQPDDSPDKHYYFNCKEFYALIKWSGNDSYTEIKGMLTKIAGIQWWLDVDEDNEYLVKWFNIVHMNKGTGVIEISFHEDIAPYLFNLQSGGYFNAYPMENVSLMKSMYSEKIYGLLKTYQYNNQRWTFENGTGSMYDLQRRIAEVNEETGEPLIPAGWSNWAIFKRDVLEPATKEINKYTDIKIFYEGKKQDLYHRKTRAIRSIEFFMVSKTGMEQMETTSIIDAEYEEIEDNSRFHQMSLGELFLQEHEQKEIEEKVEGSKYPVIASCTNGEFSETEIQALYDVAISGRVAGRVNINQWELFATDVITYYLRDIKATPDDTKTTVFRRLYDMVKNDYKNIVPALQAQYRLHTE